jgi:hypothetical protein
MGGDTGVHFGRSGPNDVVWPEDLSASASEHGRVQSARNTRRVLIVAGDVGRLKQYLWRHLISVAETSFVQIRSTQASRVRVGLKSQRWREDLPSCPLISAADITFVSPSRELDFFAAT